MLCNCADGLHFSAFHYILRCLEDVQWYCHKLYTCIYMYICTCILVEAENVCTLFFSKLEAESAYTFLSL